MAYPIWKDYYVSLGSADSCEYRILVKADVIYSGKAWKKPGEAAIKVRINDICADFLNHTLPNLSPDEFTALEYPITFVVQKYSSGWTNVASVEFLNDWSYDYSYNVASQGMAAYNAAVLRGVPARYLYFPDENHWVLQPQNREGMAQGVHTASLLRQQQTSTRTSTQTSSGQ